MSRTLGTAIVALLLLGSVSDAHVVNRKSARHHHGYALSVGGAMPDAFTSDAVDRRGFTAPVMRNGGFGCDPDFGPNGYNPCNDPGQ